MKVGTPVVGNVIEVRTGDSANNTIIEMGKVYESTVKVSGKLVDNLSEAIYKSIMAVRQQYPNIIINYIEVNPIENGAEIRVQMFDDPQYSLGAITIIVILVLILAILIVEAKYHIVEHWLKIIATIAKEMAKVAEELIGLINKTSQTPMGKIGLELTMLGAGIGVLSFSVGYAISRFKR